MTVTELLQKRAALWEQAKGILDAARKENRSLSAEDQGKYDALLKEMDELKATADREQRATEIDKEMRSSTSDPVRPSTGTENRGNEAADEYRKAFDKYLREGKGGLDNRQRSLLVEQRSLSAVTGSAGGYAIGEASYGRLVEEMKSIGGIRLTRAEVLTTDRGEPMPIPIADDTANKGRRLAEGGTANTTTDQSFASRDLNTYLYTSEIVKVPFALAQDPGFDFEGYLWRTLAKRIQAITNEEFTTGTGSSQPLGIVSGAGAGKVAATGQVDTITYQDLVDLLMSVDAAYRQNGEWQLNDNTLKAIMGLVDGNGRPLWVPSLAAGVPDMILGKRYVVNNDMPDLGAGKKPVVFGDMSLYKVRDVRNGAVVLRLDEKYAEEGMIGFVMFGRHGGTLASVGKAVKYFQNAAS